MSDPVGSLQSLKKHLSDMIDSAISDNPYFGHVSREWYDQAAQFGSENVPLVTIRFGPTSVADEVYGMLLSSNNSETVKGKIENYPFTLYIFQSACRESGEDSNRYVHQITDTIKNYLEQHRFSESAYGIQDITELNIREANTLEVPRGIRRMILEGVMEVRKTQSGYY